MFIYRYKGGSKSEDTQPVTISGKQRKKRVYWISHNEVTTATSSTTIKGVDEQGGTQYVGYQSTQSQCNTYQCTTPVLLTRPPLAVSSNKQHRLKIHPLQSPTK